jgi:hypothetical protein
MSMKASPVFSNATAACSSADMVAIPFKMVKPEAMIREAEPCKGQVEGVRMVSICIYLTASGTLYSH